MIGLIAAIFFYGYFAAYYYQILQHTATGHDRDPDWPEIDDFLEDMLRPVFQVVGVLLISHLPWILASWQLGADHAITWTAEFLGMFYFPMGILAVVILGHLGGTNPLLVFPSIFRTLTPYALVAAVIIALPLLFNAILLLADGRPLVGWTVSTLLSLYLITAHGRPLGLF